MKDCDATDPPLSRLAAAMLLALCDESDGDHFLEVILEHASRDELAGAAEYLARWLLGVCVVPLEQFAAELSECVRYADALRALDSA